MTLKSTATNESTIPWIGEFPQHWRPMRLKDCVDGCTNGIWGDEPKGNETDTPVIRVADFNRLARVTLPHETVRSIGDDQRQSRELVPGDLLIEKSGGGELQPVGMVVEYTGVDGAVCSNFVARMRPREFVDSRYLTYLHAHLYSSGVTTLSIKQSTGIQNLDSSAYLAERCFLPPREEQLAIAAYLDTETTRIDGLIEEKKKLLDLIEEARSSAIYTVITKGLRLDSNLSETGVSWIGTAPSHWKVMAIKRLSHVKRGASPRPIDDERYFDVNGTYGWVRIEDVSKSDGYLRETSQVLSDLGASLSVKLEPGALFLSIAGTVGKPCIAVRKACIHDGFVYFPDLEVNPKFLFRLFESKLPFKGLGKMGTQLNLNTQTVGDIKIALPPDDEIEEIVAYLDVKLDEFDALTAHVETELDLLKELRSSTITDAVLGRIDIRGTKTH